MTNTVTQALAICQDLFPSFSLKDSRSIIFDVHFEVVHGGVHGGEHYLAGGFTYEGRRRFFLLRLDPGSDLRALLINAFKSFKN